MADPTTAALLKEAGTTERALGGAVAAPARGGNPAPIRGPEFSPEAQDADLGSPESRAALEGELRRPNLPPVARRALQAEFDRAFGGAAPAQVAAPQPAANDPLTASLLAEAKSISDKSVPDQAPERPAYKEPGALEKYLIGPAEAALSVGSSLIAAPVAAAGGIVKGLFGGKYGTPEGGAEATARANEIAHSLTYQPRTEGGQNTLAGLGEVMGATKLAGLGPTEGVALAGLAGAPKAGKLVPRGTAAEGAAEAVPGRMGSVGAAGATPAAQAEALVAKASPELQAVVKKAGDKLTPQGLRTLERHVEADTLPVPIKLTAGQATQDVTLLSQEQNARGSKKAIADRFNEQNQQLIENTNAIRERAAPDVYATTRPELGEIVIDAYKAKDAALNREISGKYQALRDANGGQFPLDGLAFVDAADKALHKALVYDHVPAAVRKTLDRLKDGSTMTFEQFEALRTNLARIARSQADGNEKHAAGIIRTALEDMPVPANAAHLKPLADAARAAARDRFALIEADPAYKAVVRGKASADKFIEKYVVGADTKNVETMKGNLAHDPAAQQTMAAGAMDRLKASAGITDNQGNFSPAGYNKALESLRPKLGILFEPEQRMQVENLGSVARNVKGQPTGSFVNNSNTAVALMGEAAKSGAAGVANVAAHGIPVGTWTRKIAGRIAEERAVARSLQTGAGIRLKDVK